MAPVMYSGIYNLSTSDVASINLSLPSGVANGDVMLLHAVNGYPTAWSTPSGWTLLDDLTDTSGNVRVGVWYRIAASEPASYTVSVATGANTSPIAAVWTIVKGANSTSPIRTHPTSNTTTTSTTSSTPASLSGVLGGDLVVVAYGACPPTRNSATTLTTTNATGNGWSEWLNQNTATTNSYNVGLAVEYKTAGTDQRTVTSNVTCGWVASSVVIPASPLRSPQVVRQAVPRAATF